MVIVSFVMRSARYNPSGAPVPFFQRPNVRSALLWSVIVIGGGYIISRVGVIGDKEKTEVEDKYGHAKLKLEGSQLYETIRKSEQNLQNNKT